MKELSDTIQNAGSDVALINTLIEEVKKATAKVMYLRMYGMCHKKFLYHNGSTM